VWTQFPLTANSMVLSPGKIGRMRADEAQLIGPRRIRARRPRGFHPSIHHPRSEGSLTSQLGSNVLSSCFTVLGRRRKHLAT
jgi:hypothetical protein